MERTYTYDNAIIHIFIPDNYIDNVYKATDKFLHKVIKERHQNGNNNQSRDFREK